MSSHFPPPVTFSNLESLLMAHQDGSMFIEDVFANSTPDGNVTVEYTTYYGRPVLTQTMTLHDFVVMKENTPFTIQEF